MIKPTILSILPAMIDIIFKTIDMMVIIIVTIQAHTLPFNRPHATTKLAIPITINIPPSTPINPPSTNNALFGMVTLVPLTLNESEELEVLLLLSTLICPINGANATSPIPPNSRSIPAIIVSIAIIVTPTGRLLSKSIF